MEPFTLFALVFAIAIAAPKILASAPQQSEPTDEEKLAKAIAKLLTEKTAASDSQA